MARPKSFDRDQALDRAVDVFWSQGYQATSMSDLRAAIGIGRQSLYDTFGDKRSLYLAALARYEDVILGQVRERLAAPGSPLRGIRRALAFYEEHNTSEAATGCLLVNSFAEFGCSDPEVHAALAETGQRFEAAWREAFERAVEAGELSGPRFSSYYDSIFGSYVPDNRATEDDVGDYVCDEHFVKDDAGHTDKAVLCVRAYKAYEGLYDALYVRGSVDDAETAFMSHFTLAGIDRAGIQAFLARFQEVARR